MDSPVNVAKLNASLQGSQFVGDYVRARVDSDTNMADPYYHWRGSTLANRLNNQPILIHSQKPLEERQEVFVRIHSVEDSIFRGDVISTTMDRSSARPWDIWLYTNVTDYSTRERPIPYISQIRRHIPLINISQAFHCYLDTTDDEIKSHVLYRFGEPVNRPIRFRGELDLEPHRALATNMVQLFRKRSRIPRLIFLGHGISNSFGKKIMRNAMDYLHANVTRVRLTQIVEEAQAQAPRNAKVLEKYQEYTFFDNPANSINV
jgi:hypothetical protein